LALLALFAVLATPNRAQAADPPAEEATSSTYDLQSKRDKLNGEIDAVDRMLAALRLMTPDGDNKPPPAPRARAVRELSMAKGDSLDAFRDAVGQQLDGRASSDLQTTLYAAPYDPAMAQMMNLAVTSTEAAGIVQALKAKLQPPMPATPQACQQSPKPSDGEKELAVLVGNCATEVESIIQKSALPEERRKAVEDATKSLTELKNTLTTQFKTVNDQFQRAQEKEQKKFDISQTAVTYIVPIVGFFLVIILIVPRWYPAETQKSIFQNALLLELLSVYLLISTILLLGLSGRIEGNTLGTLLGGISGYVLGKTMQSAKPT